MEFATKKIKMDGIYINKYATQCKKQIFVHIFCKKSVQSLKINL